jgi:hypothetical protein
LERTQASRNRAIDTTIFDLHVEEGFVDDIPVIREGWTAIRREARHVK